MSPIFLNRPVQSSPLRRLIVLRRMLLLRRLLTLCRSLALCSCCSALPLAAQPQPEPPFTQCRVQNSPQGQVSTSPPDEAEGCDEFGAAVGELGLEWRKKLPSQVRWINRKDAANLCAQAQSELGHKVDGSVPGGCVFLAPQACTIVTNGPVSPATLGNAVRHCAS